MAVWAASLRVSDFLALASRLTARRAVLLAAAGSVLLVSPYEKAAVLILCALGGAAIFAVERPRFDWRWLPWLAVLLTGAWATAHALSPMRALGPAVPRADGFVVWAGYVVVGMVASITPDREGLNNVPVRLVGGILALVAMAQAFGWTGISGTIASNRPWGTLNNSLFLGGALALVAPIVWSRTQTFDMHGRELYFGGADFTTAALPALVTAALIWSGSRSAIIGAAVGICLVKPRIRRDQLLYVAVLTVALAAAPLFFRSFPSPSHAIDATDVGDRLAVWKYAAQLVWQHPWGFGYNEVWILSRKGVWDAPHNDFAYVGLAAGLPGLAAYALLWLVTLGTADPRRRAALLSYGIWAQFAWPLVGTATLWAIVAGGSKPCRAAGGASLTGPQEQSSSPSSESLPSC